ncbi:MAG: Rrf2 family transcriptional regulator, partial [Geobacteraceae bacterium]|nr:Rrf2 family transcriptional regulator [Geobacteraceae bacterium]
MRLSTKSRYGLRAMFDIAYNCGNNSTQIQEISRRQQISQRYLEQIFQSLKKAGILTSKRGPQGGYMLARKPEEITLAEIVKASEGDLKLVECSRKGTKKAKCELDGECVTQTVWQGAEELLTAYLAGMNLQTLCERGEQMGMRKEG